MQDHVYRFYDAEHRLLYVGVTRNPADRLRQHTVKPWWPLVSSVTFTAFASRESALAAEKAAIQTEHPRFNIQHAGPRPGGQPAGNDPWAAASSAPVTVNDPFDPYPGLFAHWEHFTGRFANDPGQGRGLPERRLRRVPCSAIAGEFCISCGPDAEALLEAL